MADMPDGVEVLFDHFESSDATSDESNTTSTSSQDSPTNYHQEQYPSYTPPHKRGHNTGTDKFVNYKKNGEADKVQGVDNDKYQRLMLPVPFALPRDKLGQLKIDFPGVYFHCRDNGNHDHPFSHLVTMIGTRFMQRRIKPGKVILDVYGNPNACDRFNASQIHAQEPKFMKALVNRVGPTDFIREVNKWGPYFDDENGVERYHRGPLMGMVRSGEIENYDVLHLTHTLYYVPFEELAEALHAPGKRRVAYALIHKHVSDKGTLNDGEQQYTKKWVGGVKLVRQVNVATGSAYVHPDLTGVLWQQNKVWMPPSRLATRSTAECHQRKGLAWELHLVNDDTWIVEMVPYVEPADSGVIDYAGLWDDDDELKSREDPLSTTSSSEPSIVTDLGFGVMIPTNDGKFVEVEIPSKPLFQHLRMRCSGKERTQKLLEELVSTANHLVNPSALFGTTPGMRCPPDKIYDVAFAAFMYDVEKEMKFTQAAACLRPVLNKHTRNLKLGPKYKDLCLRDAMSVVKMALQGVRDINHVVRAKDPVDLGLDFAQQYIG